jgi:hypothetical protein
MSSFTVTIYDRDRYETAKKVLREFEVVASHVGVAYRTASRVLGETRGARSYDVERN